MLHKTAGIVISATRYKESSLICKIFTEQLGLKVYVVNHVRTTKSKAALFQALHILDLVVYDQANRDIHRISEYRIAHNYHSIPFQIKKSAMVLFLAELLQAILHEDQPEPELFHLLHHKLIVLDGMESGYENFHLHLMAQIAVLLGIWQDDDLIHLDQSEQSIVRGIVSHTLWYSQGPDNHMERNWLLKYLVDHLSTHLHINRSIKSIAVLQQVFH